MKVTKIKFGMENKYSTYNAGYKGYATCICQECLVLMMTEYMQADLTIIQLEFRHHRRIQRSNAWCSPSQSTPKRQILRVLTTYFKIMLYVSNVILCTRYTTQKPV